MGEGGGTRSVRVDHFCQTLGSGKYQGESLEQTQGSPPAEEMTTTAAPSKLGLPFAPALPLPWKDQERMSK